MFCRACIAEYTELTDFLLDNYDISEETIKDDVFVGIYLKPQEIQFNKIRQVILEHRFALDGPEYTKNIIE